MGLLARLSRVVPLILVIAVIAAIIYLVVSWRRSPARAKEVLITVFTWFFSLLSGAFLLIALYSLLDGSAAVFDLAASFLAVTLAGLLVTRICNRVFLKHNPHYRQKRLRSTVKRRWPWQR